MSEQTGSRRGHGSVRKVALVGTHLPRHCGIATFTSDLADAIEREHADLGIECSVVAMTEVGEEDTYPPRVRLEISAGDIEAYERAADYLNVDAVDVVSIQHEFGIFGGKAGGHLLELLRDLRVPAVTTLHTILAAPDVFQRAAMDGILQMSERIVVMSSDGAKLLQDVYGFDPARIDVIPHGIPAVPERPSKERIGAEDQTVLLTFGLLSPDKGIEYVIDAMPAIVAKHPNTVYIVLGATHPHVKRDHGEAYRHMLQTRAERLGVGANVVFHNRFVSQSELVEFLGAADLYVTPYLKEEQSTSGTLAYAIGSGKAVLSTPYRYARELLAEGRGILVPWRDSVAIAREAIALLDDPAARAALQRRALELGKTMGWPNVAHRYAASFEQARDAFAKRRATRRPERAAFARRPPLPEIDLTHVRRMTDDTGMLQHATYDVPRLGDGYCIDDNARALLLLTHVEEAGIELPQNVNALATRYLSFMEHAFDPGTAHFRNFMTFARHWHDGAGSDDSHGRAIWALGFVVGHTRDPGRFELSRQLFRSALPVAPTLTSPRAWAYALLGIDEYLRTNADDKTAESVRAQLVSRLVDLLHRTRTAEWPWFEDRLTYCNARLPQALIVSAVRMGDADTLTSATSALSWLIEQEHAPSGTFSPVGTNGFHVRGGLRAKFDQQPVEACGMVSACIAAHRATGEARYMDTARRAFNWFLGQNSLDAQVYDARTGGCRDGIHVDRLNENQGAESTLSFLLALAEMRSAARVAAALLRA